MQINKTKKKYIEMRPLPKVTHECPNQQFIKLNFIHFKCRSTKKIFGHKTNCNE